MVREGIGMFDRISTRGASEIVVESPDHGMTLQSADEVQIERVLWMYRDRVKDLKRDLKIRNVVVTRRHGKPGSRIRHPYSRILAAPIVFDDLRTELTQAREYYAYKRRCVFCDTIREEAATGDRLIQMTPHFATFVPYAARVPFELRILPRRHASAFEAITPDEVADLARLLKSLCGLLAKGIGDPSYEITLHTAPNLAVKIVQGEWDTIERDYHWHLEILVEPEHAAGVSGIAVTDMLPEEAARILREAGRWSSPEAERRPASTGPSGSAFRGRGFGPAGFAVRLPGDARPSSLGARDVPVSSDADRLIRCDSRLFSALTGSDACMASLSPTESVGDREGRC